MSERERDRERGLTREIMILILYNSHCLFDVDIACMLALSFSYHSIHPNKRGEELASIREHLEKLPRGKFVGWKINSDQPTQYTSTTQTIQDFKLPHHSDNT